MKIDVDFVENLNVFGLGVIPYDPFGRYYPIKKK